MMVMMWLELCMSYSSSCHNHLHHP